jgi:hypothetical protein
MICAYISLSYCTKHYVDLLEEWFKPFSPLFAVQLNIHWAFPVHVFQQSQFTAHTFCFSYCLENKIL